MTETASSTDPLAVGVDVGGTNLRVALVSKSGVVLEQRRVSTPVGEPARFLEVLLGLHGDLTATLAAPTQVPVGLGIASLVRDGRVAVYGPNLRIGEVDLVAAFGQRGITDVVVENDASAATYGEWRVGAARDRRHAVMVTLGTGVGGGLIIDGALVHGADGFAGEVGHLPLVPDGRRCACGRAGCLEAYASGTALGVAAVAAVAADPTGSTLGGVDVIDGAAVVTAASNGDALAIDVLQRAGRWLGIGLVGLVNVLDPEVVVVGGGAAGGAARWMLPEAAKIMAAQIEGHAHRVAPPVVLAALGDDAGIIGAALLALDRHDVSPRQPAQTRTPGE